MRQNIILLSTALFVASIALMSCSDDDKTSRLPVFDKVTVSPQTASAGDTLTFTVSFRDPGSYVNGTYKYYTTPAAITGSFTCGSSKSSYTFTALAPDSATTYTLTVNPPEAMAAYAGSQPYIDAKSMGTISTTFTVTP